MKPTLPTNLKAKAFIRFLVEGLRKAFYFELGNRNRKQEKTHSWKSVLCLIGLDYFSTLAYQPGIALMAVGALAPFASLLLVIVTLFGALPTYFEVAKRSFTGQGSIAMLEKLITGWKAKFVVLALIAFAVTDFFITITLSASDAAAHIVDNPYFSQFAGHNHLLIALVLVLLLGAVFFVGIKEAIIVAVSITIPFLILTFIVVVNCLKEIILNPNLIQKWLLDPVFHVDNVGLLLVVGVAFPKLALGLSGFETGVSTMPLIHNKEHNQIPPIERIKGTKKMLLAAATIMSFFLLSTSLVTSIFLTQEQVSDGGIASGRALSYLAHSFLGNTIGTFYDLSTIIILWFAGASALAGLLSLIPRYLPRFGMAPNWVELRRPLVILITAIALIIIEIFKANVNAQSGAYATGVLALILSAAIAVTISIKKERKNDPRSSSIFKLFYFIGISVVFTYTLFDNIYERPDGIIIAFVFFIFLLLASALSRWLRAFELRVEKLNFSDLKSEELFNRMKNKKIDLVPVAFSDNNWLIHKEKKIHSFYKQQNPLVFLEVQLRDDRSEFVSPLEAKVEPITLGDKTNFIIRVTGAVAIPNTVAYISEQLDPGSIYLGLARKNAMEQAFFYLLFGEGEIGIITYKVLVHYWENSKEDNIRPKIFLMSE